MSMVKDDRFNSKDRLKYKHTEPKVYPREFLIQTAASFDSTNR